MKYLPVLAIGLFTLALPSCSGSDSKESLTPATDLSQRIDKAIESGDFDLAAALCDSLNARFPDSVEQRKLTIAQRARIAQDRTLAAIPEADARLAELQQKQDSLTAFFRSVKVSEAAGGYMLEKSLNPGELHAKTPALQPRVGTEDMPWMIIVNTKSAQAPTSMTLISPDGQKLATANTEQFGSDDFSDGMASTVFTPEACAVIGEKLSQEAEPKGYKIALKSQGGQSTIALTPAQARAIARSYQLAKVRADLRQALINREALERTLATARNQLANQQ